MQKTFVLDTNILLNSPNIILSLDDNHIVIPNTTIEELDTFKEASGELGYNARETSRILSSLRKNGNMKDGVKLPNGGTLRIEYNHSNAPLPDGWKKDKPDNRIIQVCVGLKEDTSERIILITNDINMQIKADICGIEVQDFKENQVSEETLRYKGTKELLVPSDFVSQFYKEGFIPAQTLYNHSTYAEYNIDESDKENPKPYELIVNEFVILKNSSDFQNTAVGMYDGVNIRKLQFGDDTPFAVSPRNVSQRFAQEALLTPAEQIPLVILKGPAGTAKTFYSLASGLEQVIEQSLYKKVLVCRPNIKFDDDVGFLPGVETEKIAPLMRPIFDNLAVLFNINTDADINEKDGIKTENPIKDLFERGWLVTEAMAYMRGRSINDTYIIIDEAQNATPNQIIGLITRCGTNSKIVLCGDPDQIDSTKLDKRNNGLVYASEKMKGSPLCAQITFDASECVRSKLAQEASERLVIKK